MSSVTNQVLSEVQRGFRDLGTVVRDGFRVTQDTVRQYCTGDFRQAQPPTEPQPPLPPPPPPPTVPRLVAAAGVDAREGPPLPGESGL